MKELFKYIAVTLIGLLLVMIQVGVFGEVAVKVTSVVIGVLFLAFGINCIKKVSKKVKKEGC